MQDFNSNIENNWIYLTEDGGVQKKVINQGEGVFPELGNTVEVNFSICLESGVEIEKGEAKSFILGRGANIKGLEIALPTMKTLEKSIFKIKSEYAYGPEGFAALNIPSNSTLIYESELIKFYDHNTIVKNNTPVESKIKNAQAFKEEGIQLFLDKNYSDAVCKFKEGLELLYGEGLNKQASELMMNLNLNICNCLNNMRAYETTIERLEFSLRLRKDHPKIYYYRAFAYINLGKVEEAEKDYDRLSELIPSSDAGLVSLRRLIDEKLPKPDKKIFKSFFKNTLYDDVDKKNRSENSGDDEDSDHVSNNIFHVYNN